MRCRGGYVWPGFLGCLAPRQGQTIVAQGKAERRLGLSDAKSGGALKGRSKRMGTANGSSPALVRPFRARIVALDNPQGGVAPLSLGSWPWATIRRAVGALLAVLLCEACEEPTSPPSPPADTSELRELDELSTAQRRVFLKGFPGDWRADTAMARDLPEPAAGLPVPAGARVIELPAGSDLATGDVTVADAIARRRSLREFSDGPLSLDELSFLLSATQGITHTERDESGAVTQQFRAAPSGGGRYPLETFLAVQRVEGLEPGLYRYLPTQHDLLVVREDATIGTALRQACYDNPVVADAALVFIWAAVPERTEWKYGCIAHKMVAIEAGHVCQNLYLASESVGVGTCAMLGYHQPAMDALIGADGEDLFTIYLGAVGKPAP